MSNLSGIRVGSDETNSDCLFERSILCKLIEQAVNYALGRDLSDIVNPYDRKMIASEKAAAIEYLLSDQFEMECDFLERLPDSFCEEIRTKVTRGLTYQMPALMRTLSADKEAIKQEYLPKGVTQKELAKKYGVTQQAISKMLNKRKHTRITHQDAEKMREEYTNSSVKLREMSAKFCYSQSVISHVINGNYAHMAGAKS
jgi:transposase-like protein